MQSTVTRQPLEVTIISQKEGVLFFLQEQADPVF